MKRLLFFAGIAVGGLSLSVRADEALQSLSAEAGRRSTFDDFEEEAVDTQYIYHAARLKTRGNAGRRSHYEAGADHGRKNYKTANLYDNRLTQVRAKMSFDLKEDKISSSLWGVALAQSDKRFDQPVQNDFNRFSLLPFYTRSRNELYRLTLSGGFDRTDYVGSRTKDQHAAFGMAEGSRHLLDGKLTLLSSLKLSMQEKKNALRQRTKKDFMAKADKRFARPLLRRASLRVNLGQRDTKEDDARDIDHDYSYWNAQASTYHDAGDKTETELTVEAFRRNYLGAYPDTGGALARNRWKRVLITNERARWWVSAAVEYKQARSESPGDDYSRKFLEINTVFWRKEHWKAGAALGAGRYHYASGQRNNDRYKAALTGEKSFAAGKWKILADVKYRFSRRALSNDSEEKTIALTLERRSPSSL